MSNVYFIGDTHFGHKNVINFRPEFKTLEEHDEVIYENILGTVTKRDILYVMGDAAFSVDGLERFATIRCEKKYLVRGNHDVFSTQRYLIYFDQVFGIVHYKKLWLTHAPIHPDELRGKYNVHGHVHRATIQSNSPEETYDKRYINVSAEAIGYAPISLTSILDRTRSTNLLEE